MIGGLRQLLGLGEDRSEDLTPQVQMGIALGATKRSGDVYAGTVPAAVVARRRVKNRAARRARRVNRTSR